MSILSGSVDGAARGQDHGQHENGATDRDLESAKYDCDGGVGETDRERPEDYAGCSRLDHDSEPRLNEDADAEPGRTPAARDGPVGLS